jgi:hypothetical protein
MRDNPITTFSRDHYEQPFVSVKMVLGTIALVSEPAAIRRILVENSANYVRDDFQQASSSIPSITGFPVVNLLVVYVGC